MLDELQQLATLVATVGGITVAFNGLGTWKRELTGKRDMELCQKVILVFYEAEERMKELRNPIAFPEEGASRPQEEGETEDRRMHLNTAYVPLARWYKQVDFWVQLMSLKWQMRASFGDEAVEPFTLVDRAVRRFRAGALGYYRSVADGRPRAADRHERWEADIWGGFEENDELEITMKSAIQRMEEFCVPVVRSRRPSPLWNKTLTKLGLMISKVAKL